MEPHRPKRCSGAPKYTPTFPPIIPPLFAGGILPSSMSLLSAACLHLSTPTPWAATTTAISRSLLARTRSGSMIIAAQESEITFKESHPLQGSDQDSIGLTWTFHQFFTPQTSFRSDRCRIYSKRNFLFRDLENDVVLRGSFIDARTRSYVFSRGKG